jgi:hypothetical protein
MYNRHFFKSAPTSRRIAPLFLEINHHQVNTLLELSKVSPFVLLYFDETLNFIGASYSLNGFESPFGISTQAKKILLFTLSYFVPVGRSFSLNFNFIAMEYLFI